MKYDWQALLRNMENPLPLEEQAERIAEVLRSGEELSPTFRRMLAGMISGKKNSTPFVLRLSHKHRGRPKGPDWRLAFEMERLVDEEGCSIDEAIYRAQQRFGEKGASRRNCLSALARAREWTIDAAALEAARVQKTK